MPGRAEHERHAERDLVDRRLEVQARLEEALAELLGRHVLRRVTEQQRDLRLHLRHRRPPPSRNAGRLKPYGVHTKHHQQDRRRHQQDRLDDLHPRRRHHAAEQHVGQHQHADDDHRDLVVDADQRLHQHAAADHLRGQVERRHRDRRQRADDPRRLLDCCGTRECRTSVYLPMLRQGSAITSSTVM